MQNSHSGFLHFRLHLAFHGRTSAFFHYQSKVSNKDTKKSANNTVTGKVSINNATKEELMTLTGIGESKANNIRYLVKLKI